MKQYQLTKILPIFFMIVIFFSAIVQKKIVGYVFQPHITPLSSVDYTKITHFNLAFENLDAAGYLSLYI